MHSQLAGGGGTGRSVGSGGAPLLWPGREGISRATLVSRGAGLNGGQPYSAMEELEAEHDL